MKTSKICCHGLKRYGQISWSRRLSLLWAGWVMQQKESVLNWRYSRTICTQSCAMCSRITLLAQQRGRTKWSIVVPYPFCDFLWFYWFKSIFGSIVSLWVKMVSKKGCAAQLYFPVKANAISLYELEVHLSFLSLLCCEASCRSLCHKACGSSACMSIDGGWYKHRFYRSETCAQLVHMLVQHSFARHKNLPWKCWSYSCRYWL